MMPKLIVTYSLTEPGMAYAGVDRKLYPGQWVVQRMSAVPDGKDTYYSYGPTLFRAATSRACFDWIAEMTAGGSDK
jgi:hypothetical protein